MASRRRINGEGDGLMGNKSATWMLFAGAMIFWLAFFYIIDFLIMEGQGLPVAWNLMPA
jgi:hypothetical protein